MSTSFASSRTREVEHRSASACKIESGSVIIPSFFSRDDDDNIGGSSSENDWKIKSKNETSDDDQEDENEVHVEKCMMMASGTTVRVAPMERSRGGWDDEHFHEHLRLPEGSNIGKGMLVMLEAIARECVAVALSPYHSFDLGKTYVVHFGANGNLQTVFRRRINHQEAVDASFPSRVCAENFWVPYWIVLQNGKLSAGVGRVPGKQCIGTLDDSMYNMLRSGMDAVRYVGIGNSALGRNARDVRVRGVCVSSIPGCFEMEGIPMDVHDGNSFVNILEEMGRKNRGMGSDAVGEGVPTEAELLAEYEKERAKARARAEKFGTEYKEPAPDAFLKWSEARRLRANPERGFITGIDTFSTEEKAKADARKERFARDERKRKGLDAEEANEDLGEEDDHRRKGDDEEEGMEDDEDAPDDIAEWEKTKKDPLPLEQAWDNWKLVERFRVDPPRSLYSNVAEQEDLELSDSYGNDVWHGHGGNGMGKDGEDGDGEEKPEFIPKQIVPVPTKIHVFSNDWSAFKQIRSDDLMSYFKDYGPSYVEWLGELSCNVLFEDRHSAARAFHAMSQELPTPPPESAKKKRSSRRGEESKGIDMDGDVDKEVAEGSESPTEVDKKEEEQLLPDYGVMGWRFCKWTVRKVSNDRYGRRGTRARVLMRMATSADTLDNRPTEWPRPPPGFSTKRVLMPNNDFKRRHQRGKRDSKRRRKDGRRDRDNRRDHYDDDDDDDYYNGSMGPNGEHPLLSKGLSSGRAGFSVEELEAERMAKHHVTEEELS